MQSYDTKRTPVRVFLDELPWDVRSRNTDWRYVRFALPQLQRYEPSMHLSMQTSPWITLRENARILRDVASRKLGIRAKAAEQLTSTLSSSDLRDSAAHAVFSHRAFPTNAGKTPVIWQNCVLDPRMQIAYGATSGDIASEIARKGPLYRRCTAIQVSTNAEAKRLAEIFPDIAERFVGAPFFTPHVRACEESALRRHLDDGPVRILFVGNQVLRKGLDLLLNAFLGLTNAALQQAHLTVISNFVPPVVAVPNSDRITVIRGADTARVMHEMSQAHIFVNVARFESYGLVFHEAMSQGLACLAPNWEVQRELFDDGVAGKLLACDSEAIRFALEELILQPKGRYRLGGAAWQRFKKKYAPEIVARNYADLFERVATDSDV